jgi:hypothetical protein
MKDYFQFMDEIRRTKNGKAVDEAAQASKLPVEPIEMRLGEFCDLVWARLDGGGIKIKIGSSDYFEIPREAHQAVWEQVELRLSSRA